jgi:very-short-patch-repair endonuclease
VKFRRQVVICDFIVDFYCADPKIAVEVDGPHHEGQPGYDSWRESILRAHGVYVHRIPYEAAIDIPDRCSELLASVIRTLSGESRLEGGL